MTRLATRFERAEESTGLLLWQVTHRWQAAQRAALAPHGLTHVQFVLLASLLWLAADGEPVTQARVARHAATDPMMTSQVLRALERKGLVRRQEHPGDARARAVAATEEGAATVNAAIASVEACDRAFFAPAGRERTALTRALRSLAEAHTAG